jgi:hypothetical protein
MLVKNNRITNIFILSLALCLALYLRSSDLIRGTDSTAYMDLFNEITEYSKLNYQYYMNDYGFSHYSFIVKKFTDNAHYYLFITFFISTLILFISYYIFLKDEQSIFLYLSIIFLLFSSSYYLLNLNGIRQGLCLSFVMLSYALYYEKKNVFSIILLLIAFSFHKSAIFAFIALFIIAIRSGQLNPIFIFYFCTIIGLVINADLLIQFFDYLQLDNVAEKIKNFNRPTKGNTSVSLKLFVLFVLVNYFSLIRRHTPNKLFLYLTDIYIIYASVAMLLLSMDAFVNRVLLFFGLIEPLIFATSIHCFKHKQRVIPFIIIFGLLYFLFVVQHPSFRSELRLSEFSLF